MYEDIIRTYTTVLLYIIIIDIDSSTIFLLAAGIIISR